MLILGDEPDLLDSTCSTPYVSAPSSPGRNNGPPNDTRGYFFSAPASPMHFVLSSAPSSTCPPSEPVFLSSSSSQPGATSFEFELFSSSGNNSVGSGSMSSADELFLNGQIRPMKLSSHLQRPQILAPVIDLELEEIDAVDSKEESVKRGRDLKLRSRSLHRKARSLSPLRNQDFQDFNEEKQREDLELESKRQNDSVIAETKPPSSRSSSSGRNSKKWVFLKDLLYRSKSEGRADGKEKFRSLSFAKEKNPSVDTQKLKQKNKGSDQQVSNKKAGAGAKRRVPPSPHELHYTANRAQAEEMKKRTYLPYRQGLFGCLGFSSKGYGALNGLARSLNPVSSR